MQNWYWLFSRGPLSGHRLWYTNLWIWWYILVSEKWYKIRAHTRTIITKHLILNHWKKYLKTSNITCKITKVEIIQRLERNQQKGFCTFFPGLICRLSDRYPRVEFCHHQKEKVWKNLLQRQEWEQIWNLNASIVVFWWKSLQFHNISKFGTH